MPQVATAVENNFKAGFVTEFTGLNFPEQACTETLNCSFEFDGSVRRRLGYDFENNYTTKAINRTNSVVVNYLWKNVSGDGNVTLNVSQIGNTVYFYKVIDGVISTGAIASTVTLTPVSGAPGTSTVEAQFSDGNGFLFITHPYCELLKVSYNSTTETVSSSSIIVKIRDFEGATADPYAIDTRPTATLAGLNVSHHYNLLNQGWLTTNLTTWDGVHTTMPSNADVMWSFKDTSNNFDASAAAVDRVTAGNTPAAKGHFILTLSNQDRDTASGLTGVAATTSGHQRFSTSAFFAGRAFYAGINYAGFNSKIYFTQLVERDEQYGFCYQTNDPTSEDLFDLLPVDGGVISIPEAGTIFKLVAVPGGLAIFAANGVWFITGSTGLGFAANDYTVQKIATITTTSASSFVDVQGFPIWWNNEGIFTLSAQGGGLPQVQSLTDSTIKTYYDTIPVSAKENAKGFYNKVTKKAQWLFKTVDTTQLTSKYEYDRILNFDTRTGAFYVWTIPTSTVNIHAIVVVDSISGTTSLNNIVDGSGNQVIDGSGDDVVSFSVITSSATPSFKYLTSYPSGGSYLFTFSDASNSSYLDWFKFDITGINFDSYFTTGYKIRGQANREFQPTWITVYSRLTDPVQFYFQGLWDYATSGNTGRWSTKQYISHSESNYSTASRRIKVRGHGKALQFKVTSVDGQPFDIIGWAEYSTGNQIP